MMCSMYCGINMKTIFSCWMRERRTKAKRYFIVESINRWFSARVESKMMYCSGESVWNPRNCSLRRTHKQIMTHSRTPWHRLLRRLYATNTRNDTTNIGVMIKLGTLFFYRADHAESFPDQDASSSSSFSPLSFGPHPWLGSNTPLEERSPWKCGSKSSCSLRFLNFPVALGL